jgi:hypothetical protein
MKILKKKKKYTEEECDSFFKRLYEINKEMNQGNKVKVDVGAVLKKEKN